MMIVRRILFGYAVYNMNIEEMGHFDRYEQTMREEEVRANAIFEQQLRDEEAQRQSQENARVQRLQASGLPLPLYALEQIISTCIASTKGIPLQIDMRSIGFADNIHDSGQGRPMAYDLLKRLAEYKAVTYELVLNAHFQINSFDIRRLKAFRDKMQRASGLKVRQSDDANTLLYYPSTRIAIFGGVQKKFASGCRARAILEVLHAEAKNVPFDFEMLQKGCARFFVKPSKNFVRSTQVNETLYYIRDCLKVEKNSYFPIAQHGERWQWSQN